MTRAQSTVFRRNSPAVAVGCPVVKLPRCYKRENKMKPKVLFAMTFAAALLAVSTSVSKFPSFTVRMFSAMTFLVSSTGCEQAAAFLD